MLTELRIENFRVFDKLDITGLRRVNLISGKNNTGKTALLEALRIYASMGESTVVNDILKKRGQFKHSSQESYESLFNKRADINNGVSIWINELKVGRRLDVRNIPYYYTFMSFDPLDISTEGTLNPNIAPLVPLDLAVYIPFSFDNNNLQEWWDKISLTPLEKDVLELIRETIEPRLYRLDITGNTGRVLLEGDSYPLPLSSLGDGIQRILLIALALSSAKGKILLIDEFEAGLHHSVQEILWKKIFQYARKWDIQVFATTHSEDTLKTFYYVASRPENREHAFFMRLQKGRNETIEAVPYDIERLEDAIELNLEIR